MSLMHADERTHDDLACLDVDLLLGEAMTENADLKARLIDVEERLAAALHRAEMAQALNAETDKRFTASESERRMLADQVKILHGELSAAEKDALPVNTLAYGAVSRDLVTTIYRRVSRVSRGPVPTSVTTAAEAAVADVASAMEDAGREVMEGVIRREVRRRRRAARH